MPKTNISVDSEVHKELIVHLENGDRKIAKFTEAAIREKIQRESKKSKKKSWA
jgi:hypothetical protein